MSSQGAGGYEAAAEFTPEVEVLRVSGVMMEEKEEEGATEEAGEMEVEGAGKMFGEREGLGGMSGGAVEDGVEDVLEEAGWAGSCDERAAAASRFSLFVRMIEMSFCVSGLQKQVKKL